jgi:hypothetical protein
VETSPREGNIVAVYGIDHLLSEAWRHEESGAPQQEALTNIPDAIKVGPVGGAVAIWGVGFR